MVAGLTGYRLALPLSQVPSLCFRLWVVMEGSGQLPHTIRSWLLPCLLLEWRVASQTMKHNYSFAFSCLLLNCQLQLVSKKQLFQGYYYCELKQRRTQSICVDTHTQTYVFMCVWEVGGVVSDVYMYIYTHMYTQYTHAHIYRHICVHTNTCIYMHINTHTYTHMCTHTYTNTVVRDNNFLDSQILWKSCIHI